VTTARDLLLKILFKKLDNTNYIWYILTIELGLNWESKVPISGKDMIKLFLKAGYELIPGGGKGSHWKLKKKGCPMVIIPNHKELKTGTEHTLRKILKTI
jgi:predicted RNA binding protein YcfA (HicA-like mRNA interferase family)